MRLTFSKQRLGLLFVALVISSFIFVMPFQHAQAITAITLTDRTTFTSQSSNNWKTIWVNKEGTHTYFLDSSTGTFKSVKIKTSDGSTTATLTAPIVGGATTVTTLTGSTTRTNILYTQNVGGTTQQLATAATTFVTEYAATASSQLVGNVVNSMTVWIKKTGAPGASPTAIIGCFDSSGNTLIQFGTQDPSALTTSFVQTTYTTTTAARTLANGDRCGVFYNGGTSPTATVDLEYDNANVFDGTTNTIVSTGTGAQGAAAWTSQTTRELRFSLNYVYGANNINLASQSSTEIFENQGQIIRASQTDDDSTENVRTGANTAIAEKAAASSTLIGTSVYDTVKLFLKKTGSPTGTATICVMDSSANCVTGGTFGTQDVSALTTSFARMSYQSSTAISIASGQYVGIKYSGGSVGNTLDVAYTASQAYDGTNSVVSKWNGASWTDTGTADLRFTLSQEITGTPNQESGAFIKMDAGSNVNFGGVWVYWSDATKIPSSIKLSTSTDDVSYTDRVTISPTQSVGSEILELDAVYSVRYVKMTVVTWGSAHSMQLEQYVRAPTGAGGSWVSNVESSGATNSTFYVTYSSGSTTYIGQINIDSGQIIQAATITTTNADGAAYDIVTTKNAVYWVQDSTTASNTRGYHITRNLVTLTDEGNANMNPTVQSPVCDFGAEGAAIANDIILCMEEGGVAVYNVNKNAGGTWSQLGTKTGSFTATKPMQIFATQTGTYSWIQSASASFSAFSTTTVMTDSYTNYWITLPTQLYDFDGTTRTWKTVAKGYFATSSLAVSYSSTGTLTYGDYLPVETVSGSTITGVDDTPYVYISSALIVSGSGTTWTPRSMSNVNGIAPTTYTELVLTPLYTNTTIGTAGLLKMSCDTQLYSFNFGKLYVGDYSDCNFWVVLATTTATIGREVSHIIGFDASASLTDATTFTAYALQLQTSNPQDYSWSMTYDAIVVDTGEFDAAGTSQARLVYGNCYTLIVYNEVSGSSTNLGQTCANDFTTKTISFTGVTVPEDWVGSDWRCSIDRNFGTEPAPDPPITGSGNATIYVNKTLSTIDAQALYNVSILYTDSWMDSKRTFETWYNFTNVNGTASQLVTPVLNNATIFFVVYDPDTGNPKLDCVSNGNSLVLTDPLTPLGTIFGISLPTLFAILVIAIFPKQYAPFGLLVGGVTIGIMALGGLLPDVTSGIMALIIVVIAVGLVYGYRKF